MSGTYFWYSASFALSGFVADQNRRPKRCLYAQHVVQVSFVGREDYVDLGILEIQPVQIARIIIVGEQRVGSQPQKIGETLIVAASAASRNNRAAGSSNRLYST